MQLDLKAPEGPRCERSHYATIIEATCVEIYQLGEEDCPICLRLLADRHEQISLIFRKRLAALEDGVR
jgi:hypothetical protein